MSTTDVLKSKMGVNSQSSALATKTDKPKTVLDVVMGKGFQNQMRMALPKNLTADRLTRIVMTEFRKTPALQECTPASFMAAVLQAAQLGLEPGSALGQAYLVPFNKRTKNQFGKWVDVKECQLIVGYRGMISLSRRSGEILSINAYCVHAKDEFTYQLGLHPDIQHIPSSEADPGPVVFVYAVAQLRGGGVQFEVMSRAEIEAVRDQSQGWTSAVKYKTTGLSPWTKHFDEMAKKTVVRKMFKYLPVSTEANYVMDAEDRIDRGEEVTPQDVWDGIYAEKGESVGQEIGVDVPEQIGMEEPAEPLINPVPEKQAEPVPTKATPGQESGRLNWDDV